MDNLISNSESGIRFINYLHDPHCLTLETNLLSDCTCSPILEETNETQWVARVQMDRTARRAAKRAAEKALRKARGGK